MEPAREPADPAAPGPLDDPFLERLYGLEGAVLNGPRVVVPEDLFHVRPFLGLVELLSSSRADVPLLVALAVRGTDAVLGWAALAALARRPADAVSAGARSSPRASRTAACGSPAASRASGSPRRWRTPPDGR